MATNYEKYFGSPEKAASTLLDCDTIPEQYKLWAWEKYVCPDTSHYLEWLQEECDE